MSQRPPDNAGSGRFPRAPSQAAWDAMSEAERARTVAALPGEVTWDEMSPPEGEHHSGAKIDALDVLRRFFGTEGRGLYVAIELPVYYPEARRFAPDLLAVRDVERHLRDKWVVSAEGKGLDLIMEVHYGGDRRKDSEANVAFYASLGIPEYFIYDRRRFRLHGHRLASADSRTYQPILGQRGFLHSEVLDLDLTIADDRLRFYRNSAPLSGSVEWIAQLDRVVEQREREAREAEARAREQEARVAELETKLAAAQAEIERLKRQR